MTAPSFLPATATFRPRRRAVLAGLAATAVLPTALRAQTAPRSIVTTTAMIADAARAIGGERVAVTALMGPGVDPHAYRQTRSDIARMLGADAVLWHGLYLEAQLEEFLRDLAARKPVTAVAEALDPAGLIGDPEHADRFDPHVWMDPALWSEVAGVVAGALTAIDPEGAEVHAAGLAAHRAGIAAIGTYAQGVLATVPQESRVLLTAHDAFSYFGRAFGFEVVGLQGISTASEAGVGRVEELVDLVVTRNIRACFVESSVPDRALLALVEGAAARGHDLVIGGTLFSDSMGPEGSYEGTWIGMFDHNVTTIARALGGQVPDAGHQGLLQVAG